MSAAALDAAFPEHYANAHKEHCDQEGEKR